MYPLIRRMLFRLDPERAHAITFTLLARFPFFVRWLCHRVDDTSALKQEVWGMPFAHPVGLAAGLDKDGVAVNALLGCGFSFVEVGTVTPKPQPGNEKPRLFRLIEDEAIINRMGFNNAGATAMRRHLMKKRRQGIVGINFGKNKVTPNEDAVNDYLTLMDALYPVGDYAVINVSSPNTPGLRDLQAEQSLLPLVQQVLERRDKLVDSHRYSVQPHKPPVLVKLSPDLPDETLVSLAKKLQQLGIDGLIATNTTIERPTLQSARKTESGGLSGRPLGTRSTQVIRLLYAATGGTLPIIGGGGVFSAADAFEKIRAGASLVQIYTSFIFSGPGVVGDIVEGLNTLVRENGFSHISEAVGIDAETHKQTDA